MAKHLIGKTDPAAGVFLELLILVRSRSPLYQADRWSQPLFHLEPSQRFVRAVGQRV